MVRVTTRSALGQIRGERSKFEVGAWKDKEGLKASGVCGDEVNPPNASTTIHFEEAKE